MRPAGVATLALTSNLLTVALGLVCLAWYLAVYTPLKRRTSLNTLAGTIPGAIPPVMGIAAATGTIPAAGWFLFALLIAWQLPHFLSIAWIYRKEYDEAGFVMLARKDCGGVSTARQVVVQMKPGHRAFDSQMIGRRMVFRRVEAAGPHHDPLGPVADRAAINERGAAVCAEAALGDGRRAVVFRLAFHVGQILGQEGGAAKDGCTGKALAHAALTEHRAEGLAADLVADGAAKATAGHIAAHLAT